MQFHIGHYMMTIMVVAALVIAVYVLARHDNHVNIDDHSVTYSKLAPMSVGSSKLKDNAVNASKLDSTGTYSMAELNTGVITNDNGVSINAQGGPINIGDGNHAEKVNIGTGAATRDVTIGSTVDSSSLKLESGLGGIQIGTSASAKEVSIGSTTGASSVVINSGTGGISIAEGGVAQVVSMGNTTAASGIQLRVGTGGLVGAAPTPAAAIGTGAQTMTIAELLTQVLEEDPEGAATWTMPTAALAVAGIDGVQIGDHIDFWIINNATATADEPITVAVGTGGTLVGRAAVEAASVTGEENSGSSMWRMRFTGVASGSEAYTLYRLA